MSDVLVWMIVQVFHTNIIIPLYRFYNTSSFIHSFFFHPIPIPRLSVDGKYYIPMSAVIDCVETLQEKTKEKYYTSAFIPNWANKLLSSAARSVKKQSLLTMLQNSEQEQMDIYDFVKLMAVVERQHKAKKVGKRRWRNEESISFVLSFPFR